MSKIVVKFTSKEVYKLGLAAGSFACGDIDQGVHIVLPCQDMNGKEHNQLFYGLEMMFMAIPPKFGRRHIPVFKKYCDTEIKTAYECERFTGCVFMGAVQTFCRLNGIVLEEDDRGWEELFHDIVATK